MRYVWIDGRPHLWRDLLQLRREQKKAERQLTLFEMRDDARPASQATASGRYQEPLLFKVD